MLENGTQDAMTVAVGGVSLGEIRRVRLHSPVTV